MIYTYEELEAMPTLAQGQAADLKVDTGEIRIWLSRCSIANGELDPIQVERLENGRWVDRTRGPGAVYVAQGQGMRAGVRTDGGWWQINRNGTIRFELDILHV